MKHGSVLFSSLCHRQSGKVCDEKGACWGSVMKTLGIPCLLLLEEGSEKCSVWMDPRKEKGEGQRQAWWAEKGRVDNSTQHRWHLSIKSADQRNRTDVLLCRVG